MACGKPRIERGALDIAVVKGVLRHTRIQTTSDIYAHLLEETKHVAATAMDARISRVHGPTAL